MARPIPSTFDSVVAQVIKGRGSRLLSTVIPPFITVVKSRELLSSYRQFLNRCYAANAHVRSVIVVRP